jgi:O-antigen ligase
MLRRGHSGTTLLGVGLGGTTEGRSQVTSWRALLSVPNGRSFASALWSSWQSLLLAAVVASAEFGWKFSGPLRHFKWAFSVPVWLMALGVAVLSPAMWRHGKRWPMVAFLSWLAWNEIAVLWADRIINSQILTLSLIGTGAFGLWFGLTQGWHRFSSVIVVVGSCFEVASLVVNLFGYPARTESRMIGVGWGYSETGMVAAFTTLMVVSLYRRRPRVLFPLAALGLAVLVLSEARMSLVATVIGVVLILMRGATGPIVVVLQIAMVLTLGFGTIIVLGDTALSQYVSRTGNAQDASSFTGRSLVWKAAVDQIAKTPIFGLGSKDNDAFFQQAAARGDIQIPIFHAHNAFVETTLETGLIGGSLLVATLVGFVMMNRPRRKRRSGRDAAVFAFIMLGLTEALVAEGTLAVLIMGAALGSLAADRSNPTSNPGDTG